MYSERHKSGDCRIDVGTTGPAGPVRGSVYRPIPPNLGGPDPQRWCCFGRCTGAIVALSGGGAFGPEMANAIVSGYDDRARARTAARSLRSLDVDGALHGIQRAALLLTTGTTGDVPVSEDVEEAVAALDEAARSLHLVGLAAVRPMRQVDEIFEQLDQIVEGLAQLTLACGDGSPFDEALRDLLHARIVLEDHRDP